MPLLLVTYDLKTSLKDYASLFEGIKKNSKFWWHYLESVWLVDTWHDENGLAKALYPHITKEDRLLVISTRDTGQGWLPKEAWDWIIEHQSG